MLLCVMTTQGSNPCPLHWEHGLSTPRLPGKSSYGLFSIWQQSQPLSCSSSPNAPRSSVRGPQSTPPSLTPHGSLILAWLHGLGPQCSSFCQIRMTHLQIVFQIVSSQTSPEWRCCILFRVPSLLCLFCCFFFFLLLQPFDSLCIQVWAFLVVQW